ncbi:MAG: RNA methyltransferase [Desulfobacter sp.]|nr:MAG: RNA methyltransferase [Desulfobacter sp.]
MPTKKSGKPSPFEKRVKRRITGRPHTFFAACPPGLGRLTQKELAALPGRLAPLVPRPPEIREITPLAGGVEFTARLETACLAALFLGTPVRILMRMASFKAERFPALEKELTKIDWELFLPTNCTPEIRVTTRKSRLYHSDAVANRCRSAIAAGLNAAAPPGQPGQPASRFSGQTLMVRADHDRFELSLDLSGPPLFKRGIKEKVVQAPLRENLAFAILTRLGLSPGDSLLDPMCGSGTFSLEAAMIQAALPPGFFRSFAFEAWPGFKATAFAHAKNKISQTASPAASSTIFASDLDPIAVENLKTACAAHPAFARISARCCDFFDISPPATRPGVIVLNPPYGLRLGKGMDIDRFFKEIGKKLSRDFKGWRAGIIYPETRLLKALNLPLDPMPLFHGGLDLHAGLGTIPS